MPKNYCGQKRATVAQKVSEAQQSYCAQQVNVAQQFNVAQQYSVEQRLIAKKSCDRKVTVPNETVLKMGSFPKT